MVSAVGNYGLLQYTRTTTRYPGRHRYLDGNKMRRRDRSASITASTVVASAICTQHLPKQAHCMCQRMCTVVGTYPRITPPKKDHVKRSGSDTRHTSASTGDRWTRFCLDRLYRTRFCGAELVGN